MRMSNLYASCRRLESNQRRPNELRIDAARHRRAESALCPDSALLLAALSKLTSSTMRALRILGVSHRDPAEIALAVEGRQRLEEGPGIRLTIESGKQIWRKRIGLRPFWRQLDLDLRAASTPYLVATPRQRQKILLPSDPSAPRRGCH